MGDAGDWCTVSRLSYALEAATNAARGDGALLAELLALPAPDPSALARRGKDGDAGPQSEGVASSGLAWAVAVGTMHEGDSQALRTALASIALRSAVRTVLVLLDEALPQSALDQALTPELRRCLDLKVLPVDPLACTNADEAHTQRYHGTYMRFHLFGMVRRRADRWERRGFALTWGARALLGPISPHRIRGRGHAGRQPCNGLPLHLRDASGKRAGRRALQQRRLLRRAIRHVQR